MTDLDDDRAPGWEAIDEALSLLYPEQKPRHFGTVIKWAMGGPDPIDGISVYEVAGPRPHWHYVSYGFTELYSKDSDDPETSGYGFELTMRIPRTPEETDPPAWPIGVMQMLGRYVFKTGNAFADGHHVKLRGVVPLPEGATIAAALLVRDVRLTNKIASAHGGFEFLQIVGVTEDEWKAAQSWDAKKFAAQMKSINEMLVTDPMRASVIDDAFEKVIDAGLAQDGSSTSEYFVSTCSWRLKGLFKKSAELTVSRSAMASLRKLLEGRVMHGKAGLLTGAGGKAEHLVGIAHDETPKWEVMSKDEGGFLLLKLNKRVAEAILRGDDRDEHQSWPELRDFVLRVIADGSSP